MMEVTNILHVVDSNRNTDFCVISDGKVDDDGSLMGAYLNVLDYYGDRPFLVFLLDKPRSEGKVFEGVFLLNAQQVPLGNNMLLANGWFLRSCLPKSIEVNSEKMSIHTYEALNALLDSDSVRNDLEELQADKCMLIGVYPSKQHFSRGKTDAFDEKE